MSSPEVTVSSTFTVTPCRASTTALPASPWASTCYAAPADEGVDDVVLTPHYRPEDGPERAQQLQDYFEGFAVDVADAGIGVRVHLGAELGFRFGLAQLAQSVTVARLAGGPYVLVDLPPGPLSPGLEQAFFEIRTAGYRPVLAHPERHRELAADADRIEQLRAQDLLLQIDAGSLRGRFGRRVQAAFVGSDGHDLEKRPLSLRSAYEQMVGLTGAEEAQRLFARNPLLCIDGKQVETGPRNVARERPGMWSWLRQRLG